MVYRRKRLEGHVAPPPKSQFRGQGIHAARDASLENTSGPSFELRNSNCAKAKKKKMLCCPLSTDRKMRKNRVTDLGKEFAKICIQWLKKALA